MSSEPAWPETPCEKGEKLEPRIHDRLEQIQHNPKLVRSFFQHPDVIHISDWRVITSGNFHPVTIDLEME
jgi:hypothetical protein